MNLRLVDTSELPILLDIATSTFKHTYEHLNDPADFKAYLDTHFTLNILQNELDTEGVEYYFLENESDIIGFLKLNTHKSLLESDAPTLYGEDDAFYLLKGIEIERIYVLEHFKGSGAGSFMVYKTVERAIELGLKYIWLGVWSDNEKALKFYEKVGFLKCGEHIFKMGDDDQVDFLMLKKW